MKKKYISPNIITTVIKPITLLGGSIVEDNSGNANIIIDPNEDYGGTFGSRGSHSIWDDDEE